MDELHLAFGGPQTKKKSSDPDVRVGNVPGNDSWRTDVPERDPHPQRTHSFHIKGLLIVSLLRSNGDFLVTGVFTVYPTVIRE